MVLLVLIVLAVLGTTVWVVLDRPVARRLDTSDRRSALLLTLSALALTVGVFYGLQSW